ncbi:hypothetical protein [Corallococcus sp. 4LFB]|uniref:hypothetical protein n=1 Tax=Corallococcus sp. 4LFB TaxID=3383249 RepID=UPI003976D301
MRDRGGALLRPSRSQTKSLTTATVAASAVGRDLSPGSTPCVFRSAVTKARNSTGGPSVRKYTWPPCPFCAASSIPSTALATWQVDVR